MNQEYNWSKKKKILIVDDEPSLRFVLKEILSFDYDIVGTAIDGEEALSLYKQLKPDLVTMDVVMPECDGLQGLKKILEYDPQAKVVMITSIDQKIPAQELIKLGACDYVLKPFNRERVLAGIKKVLS